MKKLLIVLMMVAMASFLFVGCLGVTPDVPVAVTGVTLVPATLALTAGGATGTLVATVAPADATNTSVTWASSAPAVATVALGVVTPVAEGTATITVTTVDGSFTDTCAVTVSAASEVPASTKPVISNIINVSDETNIINVTGEDDIINLYSSDTQYMNESEIEDGILIYGFAPKYSEIQIYVDGEVVGTSVSYGVFEGFYGFCSRR